MFGSPKTPRCWKKLDESVAATPPFCVLQMLVRTRIWDQCPHMLTDKAREKWQIDPILPIYQGGVIEGASKVLRRQKHVHSQSTTPSACTLLRESLADTKRCDLQNASFCKFYCVCILKTLRFRTLRLSIMHSGALRESRQCDYVGWVPKHCVLWGPKWLHTHIFIVWEQISQLHRTYVTHGFLTGIILCNLGAFIRYFLWTC